MLRKLVIVTTTTLLALVALPASADSGAIHDVRGDTVNAPAPKAGYDIVRAGWGHAKGGRLRHWVVAAGTVGHPRTGMGSLPDLYINVPGQVADNPTCDYFLQEVPPGVGANTTSHWKYYVFPCSNNSPQAIAPVAATRPTGHRIQLVFGRHAIGSPAHYGWAMAFPSDGDNPPIDRAPDAGFKRHVLH
ncbi:MAG: hypothetical protein QOJ03_2240 [Frankiaceae bacterium]|jgi:hypothetical protein|nr:hypothetical protein [Frankiaceae bacterium]